MPHRPDAHEPPHGTQQQLARLLELPHLAQVVPHLAPDVLHRWIRHAGVDRCLDLLDATTPAQLTTILDLDLWTPLPGQDERFDADRFGEWLEHLVERDPASAAGLVTRFDRALVVTGFSEYLRVLDPGVLEPTAQTDDEAADHTIFATDGITAEIGGYLVQARRPETWDAIVALLVELASDHTAWFHGVMQGCRTLSHAGRERDDLDNLLEQPEQSRQDLADQRDDRQVERGYTTAADARAFLSRARQSPAPTADMPPAASASPAAGRSPANPIAASYLDRRRHAVDRSVGMPAAPLDAAPIAAEVAATLDEVVRVLAAEGLVTERPRGLLGGGRTGGDGGPAADVAADVEIAGDDGIRPWLDHVREHQPERFLACGRELAFLANTLIAGCRLQTRAFTPQEASDAVVATCGLGRLSLASPAPSDYFVTHDVIGLFELGWARLHRDVSVFVAEELLATLRQLPAADSPTLAGLRQLRRSLTTHVASGRPWLAHDALDVLSTLDTPSWYGLLGLLGECPVIPAVVPAIVRRSTGRIDPQRFEFIATAAHLDTVRTFMARLPDLLAG